MKPVITISLLSLPLFAIFVFYQGDKHLPASPIARPDASAAAANLEADREIVKYTAPRKPGVMTDEAKKEIASMRERTSELGQAAALLITEDVQRGMVNKTMKRLEQLYQPLFDKWGSSDADKQTILDIVRDREALFISIRTNAQKKGTDEVLKSSRVIEAERSAYTQKLTSLLGPERMFELKEVDTKDYNSFRVKLPARD